MHESIQRNRKTRRTREKFAKHGSPEFSISHTHITFTSLKCFEFYGIIKENSLSGFVIISFANEVKTLNAFIYCLNTNTEERENRKHS